MSKKVWNATDCRWVDWSVFNIPVKKPQADKIDYIEEFGDRLCVTLNPNGDGYAVCKTYKDIHGTYQLQYVK